MKHFYENPDEIRFQITTDRTGFVDGDLSYDYLHVITDLETVGVEINGSGLLVFYPRQAPELRWAISRHAFMAGVTRVGQKMNREVSLDTMIVWYPAGSPDRNFAITRAAFEFGLAMAMAALEDFDTADNVVSLGARRASGDHHPSNPNLTPNTP
ncbi:MAG: hypothetical protein AAF829_10205 [Pseudomonadota bacterium]